MKNGPDGDAAVSANALSDCIKALSPLVDAERERVLNSLWVYFKGPTAPRPPQGTSSRGGR